MAEMEVDGHAFTVEQTSRHRTPSYYLEVTFYTPDDSMYSLESYLAEVDSRRDATMNLIEEKTAEVVERIKETGKEIDEIHNVEVIEKAEIRKTPYGELEYRDSDD